MSTRVGIRSLLGVLIAAAAIIIPTATAAPSNIAGMVVVIDPGHNGSNDASINRQVRLKSCTQLVIVRASLGIDGVTC